VDAFADTIHTCVIPRDLHYIRERARRQGDKSVSGLVAFLGKTLNITPILFGKARKPNRRPRRAVFEAAVEKVINYAIGRVEAGLLTPYVSHSRWACPGRRSMPCPDWTGSKETCEMNGVELLLSQMGITSCIYIGPGSLCLALGAEDHEFADFQ